VGLDDVLSQDLDEREYARRGSENDSVMNVQVTLSRRKLACGQDRVICLRRHLVCGMAVITIP
jgi:hypothetical protein